MDNETFEQLYKVIQILFAIFIVQKLHGSIPVKQADTWLDQLAGIADKTQTKLDDMLVSAARVLNDLRRESGVGVEADAEVKTNGDLTIKEPDDKLKS